MTEERRIQSECDLYAVTGNPVLHSKSPQMFNAVFKASPQNNRRYLRVAADSAQEALFLFRQLNLKGMNVTAPFKNDIILQLDTMDGAVERIGGVNTIVTDSDGLIGYNTDYSGVTQSLKKRNIPMEGKQYLVLGAGGAGRAAAFGLTRNGADVVILNRTYAKAVDAAKIMNCRAETMDSIKNLLGSTFGVVSTLSGNIDFIPENWLRNDLVIFDANYKASSLARKAKRKGCTVVSGEEWLLNQAIPAFRYFTEESLKPGQIDTMTQALTGTRTDRPDKIALVGFMGSGKTAVGRILARRENIPFLDTDLIIEEREGQSIPRIFRQSGEARFRNIERNVLREVLESPEPAVIACGGGVVIAEENRELLNQHALVIWLYASIAATLNRLEPGKRPLLDCNDPESEARKLLRRRMCKYASVCDLVVNSEKPGEIVAERIHNEIRKTFPH